MTHHLLMGQQVTTIKTYTHYSTSINKRDKRTIENYVPGTVHSNAAEYLVIINAFITISTIES